jgi:hypothetical protein
VETAVLEGVGAATWVSGSVDIPVVDTLRMQAFRSTPVRGLDSMVWTALDPV